MLQLQGKTCPVAVGRHEQDENIFVLVHIGNGVHRRREILNIGQRYGIHRLAAIDESYRVVLDRQDTGDCC